MCQDRFISLHNELRNYPPKPGKYLNSSLPSTRNPVCKISTNQSIKQFSENNFSHTPHTTQVFYFYQHLSFLESGNSSQFLHIEKWDFLLRKNGNFLHFYYKTFRRGTSRTHKREISFVFRREISCIRIIEEFSCILEE